MTTTLSTPLKKPEALPRLLDLAQKMGAGVCVLDLETTGFNNSGSGIVQIGALYIERDGSQSQINTLVNPQGPINPYATKVHGIAKNDVKNAHPFKVFAPEVLSILENYVVIGFNSTQCDVPILKTSLGEMYPAGRHPRHLDVRKLWVAQSGTQKGKLTDVAVHYGVTPGKAHDAMGDVLTTARLLNAMIKTHGMPWVLRHYEQMQRQQCEVQKMQAQQRPAALSATRNSSARTRTYHPDGAAQATKAHTTPKLDDAKLRVQAAILKYIATHGRIIEEDFAGVTCDVGTSLTSISFAVGDMLKDGLLSLSEIENKETQTFVAPHMDAIMRGRTTERGSMYLRAIREDLQAASGQSLDYTQLRVAIARYAIRTEVAPHHPVCLMYCNPTMRAREQQSVQNLRDADDADLAIAYQQNRHI